MRCASDVGHVHVPALRQNGFVALVGVVVQDDEIADLLELGARCFVVLIDERLGDAVEGKQLHQARDRPS